MRRFQHRAIRDLHRQLKLSPPEVRVKQADRLEDLLMELEPDRTYPHEFLYFRATGFRPVEATRQTFTGQEVMRDLHVALESLSESAPLNVQDLEERVYTVDEIAGMFSVSLRTVHRWRRRGLVSRKYIFPDGRRRTGIKQSAVDRFRELYGDQLERSRQFSRIEPEEEERITELVSRLQREDDVSLTEAAVRVAEQVDRSPEAVRLLLQRRKEKHPEEDLPTSSGRLSMEDRRTIFGEYERDVPVEELCDRYRRSKSSIYRIINQERARDLLARKIEHIHEDAFDDPDADQEILGPEYRDLMNRLDGAPPEERLGPDRQQETLLFRAYNYTKYLLVRGRQQLNPKRYVSGRLVRRLEDLARRAERLEALLARIYRPLVRRVARQHATSAARSEALQREGEARLAEAIRVFDYRGRASFSSYLTLELQKRFARAMAGESGAG